jgi:curved DNA-binding protein CbpA
MQSQNYFEILDIEPTTDLNVVKKAFRKLMMVNHPDKNGDEEKCKKIVEAWEFLQEANSLVEYYEFVRTGRGPSSGPSSTKFESSEDKPERKQESFSDSLVPHGVMLTVFIPMFVQKPDIYSKYLVNDDKDLKTMRRDNMTAINPHRFKVSNFDFNALTEIMNYVLETRNYKQIGLDMGEVKTIVNQHSWYKNYGAFFGVSVKVNIADITDKFSESDVSTAINAGTQAFLAIKQGTLIDVNNITAIHMTGTDNTGMRLAMEHDYIIYKDAKTSKKEEPSPKPLLSLFGSQEYFDDETANEKTESSSTASLLTRHGFFEMNTMHEKAVEEPGLFDRCNRCTIL